MSTKPARTWPTRRTYLIAVVSAAIGLLVGQLIVRMAGIS